MGFPCPVTFNREVAELHLRGSIGTEGSRVGERCPAISSQNGDTFTTPFHMNVIFKHDGGGAGVDARADFNQVGIVEGRVSNVGQGIS